MRQTLKIAISNRVRDTFALDIFLLVTGKKFVYEFLRPLALATRRVSIIISLFGMLR